MLAFSQPPTEKDHSATGFHKHQQNAPMLWEKLGISVSARPPSLGYQTAIISGSFRTNEVSPKGNENSVVCFLEQDGETTWKSCRHDVLLVCFVYLLYVFLVVFETKMKA